MLRFNKFYFFILFSFTAFGQNCDKVLRGNILDASTQEGLPYANIYLQELKIGTSADENGFFVFQNVCIENVHLKISHLGCEPLNSFIQVRQDSLYTFDLHHHEELLNEMVVHGERTRETLQKSSVIDRDVIFQQGETGLAALSSKIPGVSILKTGANVEKTIIQGMYGNRIAILNNGVQQAGQQWGNDHAPEIDPTMADHLAIIKGANSLAYSGSSLGGVLLVESEEIANDPHLHGDMAYLFNSQNLSQQVSTRLEKGNEKLSWRIGVSGKIAGDSKTPNYFLTNTAKNETSAFLQLEKEILPNVSSRIVYSFFRSELGILKGTSIGNLSDLEIAYTREVPFYTEENRSFEIDAPSQKVAHHLATAEFDVKIPNNQTLKINYGFQYNQRKEFDVRRAGRSDIPSLSLEQSRHQLDSKYTRLFGSHNIIKLGFSYLYTDNTNQPETGILPLIPDYLSHQTGLYSIFQKDIGKLDLEMGVRSDFRYYNVAYISRNVERSIIRYSPTFVNSNASLGAKYNFGVNNDLSLNVGMSERTPEINELYSNGLHQGIGSIEEGNPDLKKERSIKGVLSWNYSANQKFFIQSSIYLQSIDGYIFLKPELEPRLTIRGAFPVFTYSQTQALFNGLDLLTSYSPSPSLKLILNFAYVQGTDIGEERGPLIFIPPANLGFKIKKTLRDFAFLEGSDIELSYQYVASQTRFSLIQDLLPPPPGYGLLGFKASTSIGTRKQKSVKTFVAVDNLLNKTYRSYLNRQRYFADEIGRNIAVGIRYKF
ncbi:iron complex outermembrane recepter protein [Spirosomataceae bacterium TFI 002]|nr:iron complex outermembrane recepter protein [Spirosomataceae bacterium TFI 002]